MISSEFHNYVPEALATLDLETLVTELRTNGGNTEAVEVKSAAGGLPDSLAATLCAFANRPGGGLIILGLDETDNFRPVRLADPHLLAQQIANKARDKYTPPVTVEVDTQREVAGMSVVLARVQECSPALKPCQFRGSGQAYLRQYDEDYELSPVEQQGFLAQRTRPQCDIQPVSGARDDDLDPDIVADWIERARHAEPNGLGRFDDQEILLRAGITTRDRVPTVAGLLACAKYPQQFFPSYCIRAASLDNTKQVRARHQFTATGPIPVMMADMAEWARQAFAPLLLDRADGNVESAYEYPLKAFREVISNALIHRDLHEWALGRAVEVRHTTDRLTVTNPGGLYGISVKQLGTTGISSARNPVLLNICKHLVTRDGGNVVEALATGIPMITRELQQAQLPAATYSDSGITFTVILRNHSRPASRLSRTPLRPKEKSVLEAVGNGCDTAEALANALRMSKPTAWRLLNALVEKGHLVSEKIPGSRHHHYRTALPR